MAAIYYGDRKIENLDDTEVAHMLATALIYAEKGTFGSMAVKRTMGSDAAADVLLLGPGIAVSAEVSNAGAFQQQLLTNASDNDRLMEARTLVGAAADTAHPPLLAAGLSCPVIDSSSEPSTVRTVINFADHNEAARPFVIKMLASAGLAELIPSEWTKAVVALLLTGVTEGGPGVSLDHFFVHIDGSDKQL